MSDATENKAAETEAAEQLASDAQTQAEQNTELTISDLNALKVIIDVASQRGAFRPSEMEAVGKTYTRLNNFLVAVQAQQAQQEGGEQSTGEANG